MLWSTYTIFYNALEPCTLFGTAFHLFCSTSQDTPFATSVDGSSNSARSQCKQETRYTQILHANEATSRTKRIVEPDSSDKLKAPRFTGGTYSKPDARVKLIPA